VGAPADERTTALLRLIRQPYRPNVITALAADNIDGPTTIPLLDYRVKRGDAPTVYVCRNFACQMPVTTPEAAQELLGS
jgi:uncharacterized protein YyaL (SSP411 family)